MNEASNVVYRDDLLNGMRDMVEQGTDIRRLTTYLQRELELKDNSLILLLCYFRRAFSLSLLDIMPLREWLGTDDDEKINEKIMPKILKARSKWLQTSS